MNGGLISRKCWACALGLVLSGCAFDVVSVRQVPAAVSMVNPGDSHAFILAKRLEVCLGTGFPTILKPQTTWRQVGVIEYGEVYRTADQIVKVEASNIHEAQIVVSNQWLVGFYLPVEKTFAPLKSPAALQTEQVRN